MLGFLVAAAATNTLTAAAGKTGWNGPINAQYTDAQCPNVGCHGPWPGVTGPEPCEAICNGVHGCNAMNFNGGGCCLRACAPGKLITHNTTKGGSTSYYRLGPTPPPCSTIRDKGQCLEPFCHWDGQHCTIPPPPPPPPPPPGFVCNNATLTCEMVNGSNCSTTHNAPANAPKCQTAPACHKVCQPVYQCQVTGNGTNYTCVEVPLGTPGAQNHSACASTCVEPPKHNCTPPVLQGKYRGISIGGSGMPHAEWDLRLGHCDAELRNANGTVWKASVYTGGAAPLSFRLETGGELHGLYTFENGLDLETVRFTLALGKLNGNAPKDWMTAMAPGSNMTVYGLVKCASDKPGKPVPGGIYCDPKSTPPEMCPPLNPGDKPTPCHCANPDGPGGTCLCPGHYPPPPPPPPGAGSCNFTSVFEDDALVTRATGHVQH